MIIGAGRLEAAWRTAVDDLDHRKYDAEAGALQSLRRRCRGFTAAQYADALRRAVRLCHAVKEVMAPFDPPYDGYQAAAEGWPALDEAARALRRRCPGFRLDTCRKALCWALYKASLEVARPAPPRPADLDLRDRMSYS